MLHEPTYEELEKRVKELEQAELERKQNEEELSQIFSMSLDMICIADIKTATFIRINPAFTKILGYSEESLLEKPFLDFVHPDDIDATRTVIERELKSGANVINFTNRYRCKDGSYRWLSWVSHPNIEKGITFAVARDITEIKEKEKDLKKSKSMLDATGRMAKVGGWELDVDTLEVSWTEETYRIHEVPFDFKPPLQDAINFFHSEDREKLEQTLQRALKEGEPYDMEIRLITAKGNHLWTRTMCQPEMVNGKVVKLKGTFQDITERKSMEQSLMRMKNRLQSLWDITKIADADIKTISDHILSEIQRITQSEYAFYGLVDASQKTMALHAWSRETMADCRAKNKILHFPIEEAGIWADAIRNRRTITLNDFNMDHPGKKGVPGGHVPLTRLMAVPYVVDDKVISIAAVANKTEKYSEDDERQIQAFLGSVQILIDRKQVEESLRESEEKYRTLFDQSVLGIYLHDLEGNLIDVNKTGCTQLGYTKTEILGMNIFDFHPENTETINSPKAEILKRWKHWEPGIRNSIDGEHLCKDGSILPIEISTGAVIFKGRKCILAATQDITKRKQAEKALKESENHYRTLFEQANEGLMLMTLDGRLTDVNRAFAKMHGYTIDELKTIDISDLDVLGERAIEVRSDFVRRMQAGEVVRFEVEHRHKGGHSFPAFVTTSIIDIEGDLYYLAFHQDLTERKVAREKLVKQNYYLEKAQELGRIGTWEIDIINNILIWTDENCRIFGVPEGSVADYETFIGRVHPDDRDFVNQEWSAAIEGKPYDIEHRLLLDGKVKWVREKADVEFNEEGIAVRAIGFTQDITERKQAEEEIEEFFNMENFMMCISDLKGNFLKVSGTFEDILGYTSEELLGQPYINFVHPDDKEKTMKLVENELVSGTKIISFENRYKCKDGAYKWISWTGHPDVNKGVSYSMAYNITELKKLESQLQQTQKMEAIGSLAGGIAHDFNNILFPIIGLSEMLLEDLPPESLEYENAEEIYNAARRAGNLVEQILAFSRQSEHKMTPVRFQMILKEALKLIRATIPSNIEIHSEIQQDCSLVMADPTQVHQIVMNLMTNAFHAVEQSGGEIRVRLIETELNKVDVTGMSLKPGNYVLISVSDSGHGIPTKNMEKIFDPYFTTKEQGKGTGLGLAVVFGIVKEYGGDILVQSEVGKGTTFDVYFPLMEKNTEILSTDAVEAVEKGSESILLVDDEPAVVRLETQILERLGYKVTFRTSSSDALEAFRASPNSFDLIISDMAMPHMTGIELAQEIVKIHPGIPIIVCSGFSEKLTEEKAKAFGINGLLMKPVSKHEMARVIRRVLDEAKSAAQR